jgi:hypothetical protein
MSDEKGPSPALNEKKRICPLEHNQRPIVGGSVDRDSDSNHCFSRSLGRESNKQAGLRETERLLATQMQPNPVLISITLFARASAKPSGIFFPL